MLVSSEFADEFARQAAGVDQAAGVMMHLTAAGLAAWALDEAAQPFEDDARRLPDFGIEGLIVAAEKQCNAQADAFLFFKVD